MIQPDDQDASSISRPNHGLQWLSRAIYYMVRNERTTNRFKINANFPEYDDKSIDEALAFLRASDLVEYCSTGIEMGACCRFPECPSGDMSKEAGPQGDQDPSVQSNLARLKSICENVANYAGRIHDNSVMDDLEQKIMALPEGKEKTILKDFFSDGSSVSDGYTEEESIAVVDRFCSEYECESHDVELFQQYCTTPNLFTYCFGRSATYYKMLCVKYRAGSQSIETLLNDDALGSCKVFLGPQTEGLVDVFRGFASFVVGYVRDQRDGGTPSFLDCVLFIMDDYTISFDYLNALAYNLFGSIFVERLREAETRQSRCFITTGNSVKFVSPDAIASLADSLYEQYGGRAVTVERAFADNEEILLSDYIEGTAEFEQLVAKYYGISTSAGYLCFGTTLPEAVHRFSQETGLYERATVIRKFVRRYGGSEDVLKSAPDVMSAISVGGSVNQLSGEVVNSLTERFASYEWTSAENARDIFQLRCGSSELFGNEAMYRLGFNKSTDVYYRRKYRTFRDCLRQTVFQGDDLFVDNRFRISMSCSAFHNEVDYLITNLMWIPVSDNRYLNLRCNRFLPLYNAIKKCLPSIKKRCEEQYMTAFRLKRWGTGSEYIDGDEFESVFYDAVLMATRSGRSMIKGQRFYHITPHIGENCNTSGLIKAIILSEGGHCEVSKVVTVLKQEYGFKIDDDPYVRTLVKNARCIYIDDTDTVYLDEGTFKEAMKNGRND